MPRPHPMFRTMQAANPIARDALAYEDLGETLDALGATIAERELPQTADSASRRRWLRRPRTTRGLALTGVLGLLIAGGTAAAATLLTTYTGQYDKGWEVQAGGPGEQLLMGAPDFCAAALKVSSDIRYPPGYAAWRPWVLIAETQQPKVTTTGACGSNSSGGEGKPTAVSTGALHGFFAMSAFCAWVYDWREAETSGNAVEAGHAASVISGALQWPAVAAEDPHPSATAGPSGTTTQPETLFGWFIPFQNAVQDGDVSQVSELIQSSAGGGRCSFLDPPADSDGGTVNPVTAAQHGGS